MPLEKQFFRARLGARAFKAAKAGGLVASIFQNVSSDVLFRGTETKRGYDRDVYKALTRTLHADVQQRQEIPFLF
jgi:hypothetical protein